MAYRERKILYKKIEEKRNRPLITYVTSIRPNLSSSMGGDAIAEIIEQINLIPDDKKEVDYMIISNGGDPIVSLRIISMLRERFEKVSVLLPYVAYSAATILALGADEIVMHPFSNLGPIDPQLTTIKKNQQGQIEPRQFSSEDLRNFIEFIKTDVGITDQQHLITAIAPLLSDVGTLQIGSAKRGQQLTLSLSEKMLNLHLSDKNTCKNIAKALNSSYYHHGYAVGRKEAQDIGLAITTPDKDLEDLLWEVWQDFSNEMKANIVFDPIKELFENPESSAILTQIPSIEIPANTPPALAQNIFIQLSQQSSKVELKQTIRMQHLIASIESTNLSKASYANSDIAYWRNPDMSIGFNCTIFSTGWTKYNK